MVSEGRTRRGGKRAGEEDRGSGERGISKTMVRGSAGQGGIWTNVRLSSDYSKSPSDLYQQPNDTLPVPDYFSPDNQHGFCTDTLNSGFG